MRLFLFCRKHVTLLLQGVLLITSLLVVRPCFGQGATDLEELKKKALERGSISVVVQLKTPPWDRSSSTVTLEEYSGQVDKIQSNVLGALKKFDLEPVSKYDYVPYVALQANAEVLDTLAALPSVKYIYEDRTDHIQLEESTAVIGADAAWEDGYTGEGQAIAILDTGVDSDHPDLEGKVVAEACFSTPNEPTEESLCPNGETSQIGPGSAENIAPSIDGSEHGTHVAGIAAGASGVANDADIIAVQVFHRENSESDCDDSGDSAPCTESNVTDQIEALDWIVSIRNDHDISSVNMSLGGGEYNDFCGDENTGRRDEINILQAFDIATVVASGNDGWDDALQAPACIAGAVSVAGTQDGSEGTVVDNLYESSNVDEQMLDLLAPGEVIEAPVPGDGEDLKSGTSMASPHVAGAWALLKQQNPEASVLDIEDLLESTGMSIEDLPDGMTKPRIQVDAALGLSPSENGPDLTVEDESVTPTEVQVGESISVTATVTNVGDEEAIDPELGYVLSEDQNWDDEDVELDDDSLSDLSPGESDDEDEDPIIPEGTSTGEYYVLFVADYEEEIEEPNEANNVTPVAITTTPLPVEMVSFTASLDRKTALLQWRTASETNNAGFEVQHQAPNQSSFTELAFAESKAEGGTTNEPKQYRFASPKLASGTHKFRLRQVDIDGSGALSDTATVDVEAKHVLTLKPEGPNPVRETTQFTFTVKQDGRAEVNLYNVLGQEMRQLRVGKVQAGKRYRFDVPTARLSSGTYFVRLQAQSGAKTQMLTVVK